MKERTAGKKTNDRWLYVVIIIISLIFPQWIIFSASANDSTYYVSTSGSDSNAGTLASPWKTIQKAANTVTQGDTVNIRGGTYNEKVTISKAGNGDWITFRPYNNEKVIVDGTDVTSGTDGVIQLNDGSNYIHINGLEIKNAGYAGVMIKSSSKDVTDIKIDYCTIHECAASGFWVHSESYGTHYVRRVEVCYNTVYSVHNSFDGQEAFSFSGVLGFEIHHNSLSDYGREGIDCKSGSSSGSVHHNVIDTSRAPSKFRSDWNHIGVYIDGYSRTNHDIDVYGNYITGYAGSGIILNAEQGGSIENIKVYNNVISLSHVSGYSGFRCLDSLNQCSWTSVSIYSNTFYNSGGNPSKILPDSSYITNLVISNNIFSTTGSDCLTFTMSYPQTEVTLSNNLFYRSGGSGHALWSGDIHDGTNPVLANPKFISTSDFHLQSSSPAIDAGGDISTAASNDFDGIMRPQGDTADIGAYEYHETTSDTTPPILSNIQLHSSTVLDTEIGWENITCTATDDIAIQEVDLTLTNSNKVTTKTPMLQKSGTSIYYYNTSLKQSGNYTYHIGVDDTSNNKVSSIDTIFSLPPNWDINNDGICTILDKVLISTHYGQTGTPGWIREDVDNNGKINILDLTSNLNQYNNYWWK